MLATFAILAAMAAQTGEPLSASGPKIKLMTAPAPAGQPVSPAKLGKGQLYIIECKVKCDVRMFPEGVVERSDKSGPRDVTALFPGSADYEDRTFQGPFLYVLKAKTTGPVQVLVIPFGYQDASEAVTFSLDVDAGTGPRPPPDPFDGKVFNGDWRVLVIEETGDAANNRSQYFTDKALISYLAAKCKSKPRWVDITNAPADIAPYVDLVKGKKLPQCFIVASDGTILKQMDLPDTPAKYLAELKKVGGP